MSIANQTQVGGDHYRSDGIQHWDLITDNYGPTYLLGCATKYLARHRKKNGKQDLEKAEHYLRKLSEKLQEPGCSLEIYGRISDDTLAVFTKDMCTADRMVMLAVFRAQTSDALIRVAGDVAALREEVYG